MKPLFFATPAEWRNWLEANHSAHQELLVGFYRRDSRRASITWPESVDGALCFGWIDGVRRRVDEVSYSVRFTPRRPRSIWSAVNIRRAEELRALGLMQPAGVRAFEARDGKRSAIYSFEQETIEFDAVQVRQFRANRTAWRHFQTLPPGYRRTATWRVVSAKREETRARRLAALVENCAKGLAQP